MTLLWVIKHFWILDESRRGGKNREKVWSNQIDLLSLPGRSWHKLLRQSKKELFWMTQK